MNSVRSRILNNHTTVSGPVLYWMIREHRVQDNWALVYAQELAQKSDQPLIVVFCIRRNLRRFSGTARLIDYMFAGLQEVGKKLKELNIDFAVLLSEESPENEIYTFCRKYRVGAVVTDASPLIEQSEWKHSLAKKLSIPLFEVDAHNIVPVWIASDKQEYGAYTLRPKIHKKLETFLDEFPAIERQSVELQRKIQPPDWSAIRKRIQVHEDIVLPPGVLSGSIAAHQQLHSFLGMISVYSENRNDPVKDQTSRLSAHLHFGHISVQRIVLEIRKKKIPARFIEAFLEELIIRRELAENLCFYNIHYRSTKCFPNWSQESLQKHLTDTREFTYTEDEFERAKTHDQLWNAAQLQMVQSGYMHGYMRMYWAKKILEWTTDPEVAMSIAIKLNDRYELDGRDPNGYAGIAWAIGGVHDRPWFERPVFGKVRYMNFNGAKKKFDVDAYVQKWSKASAQ